MKNEKSAAQPLLHTKEPNCDVPTSHCQLALWVCDRDARRSPPTRTLPYSLPSHSYNPEVDGVGCQPRSMLCVPILHSSNTVVAVLQLFNKSPHAPHLSVCLSLPPCRTPPTSALTPGHPARLGQ